MSKATTAVWKFSRAVGTDLLVALAIASKVDDDCNVIYLSAIDVAKLCRIPIDSVIESIAHLIHLEEIAVYQVHSSTDNYGPLMCVRFLFDGESPELGEALFADSFKSKYAEALR